MRRLGLETRAHEQTRPGEREKKERSRATLEGQSGVKSKTERVNNKNKERRN